ncbi:radical SAM protein [Leptolyngbya sp. 7M]|uniref:radical SAM protein n=1 Tax=Leptolyngbya sp. 7M TaxID=2812896 RepID=UPI001B8D9FA5|nr:radical SAM protein [Leptolyngbya sp. 7M]QYO66930.1 radical SAM protein [Leptolyngbya sp. 7M]
MFSDNFRRGEGKTKGMAGSKAVSKLADIGWKAFQAVNTALPEGKSIQPKWAAEPLLKSYERTSPPLGFPRETDSLCPACVKQVRNGVIAGDIPLDILMNSHPGEIKAQIVEENGQVIMRKECPTHGVYEDVLATDARFLERIENLFFGRDFRSAEDEHVHHHGTSDIKFGRGAVLTVDLTNRCNMMCNPCFMDANQVGYVHEPTFEDIKAILDRAVSFKPRRQIIILFSGGEPTLSPFFLDAVAYAKKIGFYRILAATNGIRYAEDPEFCKAAKEAGQHGVYLQFDGTNEEDNKHRGVGNLFDVKLKAIENLAEVGIKVTLVTTIVNSWNNQGIGSIVKFAAQNIDKVQTIAFQPVSFTGRDEDVSDKDRMQQRYTLAGMTHDLKDQLGGVLEPMRDWFPLSSYSAFTSVMDMLQGADAPWGWSSCNCHPNCGIFTLMVVNKKTNEMRSLFEFFNYEQFMKDVAKITDTARGKKLTMAQLAMAIMRNYDASRAPEGFPISQIINLFKPSSTTSNSDRNDRMKVEKAEDDVWRVLCVEGMWFQDLFTYDFRRTEMCVIPYGTQEGEISFCAYNTGVGWRQIIEEMHKTASLSEWYKEHGRHAVYAKGKEVPGIGKTRSLSLPVIAKVLEEDIDRSSITPYLVDAADVEISDSK